MTSILITGASSGLGAALAVAYARPGTTLFLGGRDEVRLAEVVGQCIALGADVRPQWVDVRDRTGMENWIFAVGRAVPLDIVIANAGISGGTGVGNGESAAQVRDIFAVNVDGVINTILPAIELMRRYGKGQLVLIASLAGFRGLPTAPAYAASKAAVKSWGEGLRGWLAGEGIGVTVICPGFVESRMTAANPFPMPFLMSAEEAAQRIKRGIDKNRARVAFPWPMAMMAWLLGALPPAWVDPLLRRLPEKP